MAEKIPPIIKSLLESPDAFRAQLQKEKAAGVLKAMTLGALPEHVRLDLFRRVCAESPPMSAELLKLIATATNSDGKEELLAQSEALKQMLDALQEGPMRFGRFVKLLAAGGGLGVARAQVVLHDGSSAFSAVPDAELASALRCGDGVLLDGGGRAVLYRDPTPPATGEQATFERALGHGQLLVTLGNEEKRVIYAAADLDEAIVSGEVKSGAALLVNAQQGFAFCALKIDDKLSHYRFMDHHPVPARVEMASPPQYVKAYYDHVKMALLRPQLATRWKQPMLRCALLAGITGTGKTMSIYLLRRMLTELLAELCGVPVDQSPLKVFRLHSANLYTKWLGGSDKNMARFFDEVEQWTRQPLTLADGTVLPYTPCLALIEELDGIAASRGSERGDPIYGRILTNLLQRFDETRPEFACLPILWVATTNVVSQVDAAAMRRVGGLIEHFGPLNRQGFVGVVSKHLADLPISVNGNGDSLDKDNGHGERDPVRGLAARLAQWIYSTNGHDAGQAELVCANSDPQVLYRRHFMTGALVARSVREATANLCATEFAGGQESTLTFERLIESFDRQIQSAARQLSKENAASMVHVRQGVHVVDVRPVRQPAIAPMSLRSGT